MRIEKSIETDDFENLNVFEKIEIGIVSTMQYFIDNFDIIYILFTGILFINVLKRKRNLFFRAIAIYPLIIGLIFSTNIFSSIVPELVEIMNFVGTKNGLLLGNGYHSSFIFFLICFNYIAIIISICCASGNSKNTLICLLAIITRNVC